MNFFLEDTLGCFFIPLWHPKTRAENTCRYAKKNSIAIVADTV